MNPERAVAPIRETFAGVSDLAADVALNDSLEKAKLAGLEDAHTQPGQKLGTVWTPADKVYQQAYRQEEFDNLSFHATEAMDKNYMLASETPTGPSLASFQKSAALLTEKAVNQTGGENKYKMQRLLEGTANTRVQTLSHAVTARTKQLSLTNYKISHKHRQEQIANLREYDYHELADQLQEEDRVSTNGQVTMGNMASEEAAEEIRSTHLVSKTGEIWGAYKLADKEGKGPAFLATFADSKAWGSLSPSDKAVVFPEILKRANAQNAYKAGQQQIDYTKYQADIEAEKPIDFVAAKQKVSPVQFNQLETKYNEKQGAALNANTASIDISANSANAAYLASPNMKDARFEPGFVKLVDAAHFSDDKLMNMAIVAGGIKRENPTVKKQLSSALRGGSAQEALSAAAAITYLQNQNEGIALSGLDKEAISIASNFQTYAANPERTLEKSLEMARDQVLKQDPDTQYVRLSVLKDKRVADELDVARIKQRLFAKFQENNSAQRLFGKPETTIPDAAAAAWEKALIAFSLNGDSYADATEHANNEILKDFPLTHINGAPEMMKYANTMPYATTAENRASVQMFIEALAEQNAEERAAGRAVIQKIDYDPATLATKVDGEPVNVYVKADYFTDLKEGGVWALYYRDARGFEHPLIDTQIANQDHIARWYPKADRPLPDKVAIRNSDGSVSTERGITVEVDELNQGRPTNIPTIWDGKQLTEDEAIRRAIRSREKFPSFNTIQEAVEESKKRSKAIGENLRKRGEIE